MWTRKQLKERGKNAFVANYWKCLLAALIFAIIAGGNGGFSVGSSGGGFSRPASVGMVGMEDGSGEDNTDEAEINEDEISGDEVSEDENSEDDNSEDGNSIEEFGVNDLTPEDVETDSREFPGQIAKSTAAKGAIIATIAIVAVVALVVFLVVMAIGFVISAFLLNPFEMGCSRFFYRNLDESAKVSDVVYAFEHCYMNVVKTLFFRDLYVTLWSLLFVIPGIIKSYEYRMIPFILQDNPEISKDEAFSLSRKMMMGNKWKTFVLDLSFIGWHILSLFTCGLLSIFFVNPYQRSTNAALYEVLKLEKGSQEEIAYEA